MSSYVFQRVALNVPILFIVTVLIFTLLQLTPGDPLDAYLPPDQITSPEQREALRKQLGLDQPAAVQYAFWLRSALSGNLGYRVKNGEPVLEAIRLRLGPTLLLMISGMGLGVVLGVLFGIVAAIRRYSALDNLLTFLAFLGISTPAFLAGLIGMYVFSLRLRLFPAGGYSTPGLEVSTTDVLYHLALPAMLLSTFYVAMIMRYTRAAMLETVGQDYVRTARAKGLPERGVIGKHALRNALIPVVTIIGANLGNLVGGAVFLESIFGWPGMGALFLDGVESRDYPLIMGLTLVLSSAVLVANLLTDLAYAAIDPRIRYG